MPSIEARALGRKLPLVPIWSVPLPKLAAGRQVVTLRDLIGVIVRGEVAAFEKRRQAKIFLRALSKDEVADQAARGKVEMAGHDSLGTGVASDVAVENALQAFEDGLYLVVVDGVEHRELDAIVLLAEDTQLVFLRLTFLAGA